MDESWMNKYRQLNRVCSFKIMYIHPKYGNNMLGLGNTSAISLNLYEEFVTEYSLLKNLYSY